MTIKYLNQLIDDTNRVRLHSDIDCTPIFDFVISTKTTIQTIAANMVEERGFPRPLNVRYVHYYIDQNRLEIGWEHSRSLSIPMELTHKPDGEMQELKRCFHYCVK